MESIRWHKQRLRCICGHTWIGIHCCDTADVMCPVCLIRCAETIYYAGWSDISGKDCQENVADPPAIADNHEDL